MISFKEEQIHNKNLEADHPMDLIKQSTDNSCLACVLAMMVGESEQYVLDWFENDGPPFSDEDAYIFLAHHGVYLTLCCKLSEPTSFNDIKDDDLTVELKLHGRPYYFVVESQRFPGKTHSILWDGEKVLDPNPKTPDNLALSDYKVIAFYPMMWTEQRAKRK